MPLSPWYAINLSLLFPGLGQWQIGRPWRGLLWGAIALCLLGLIFWAFLSPNGNIQVGAGALGMGFVLWVFSLIDTHACWVSDQATARVQKEAQNRRADPWFAIFLSHLLPGLGQVYRGQWGLGLGLLLLTLVFCSWLYRDLSFGGAILTALACAQLSASLLEQRSQRWGIQLAIAILLARGLLLGSMPLVHHFVEPFTVPSESMYPTLTAGDRILVTKRSDYQPQPGDIVVFQNPTAKREQFFVKRVVGIPGDRILVEQGQTWRNGQSLVEPYLDRLPDYRWEPEPVPPRHLLVLGDNRNESYDSHVWGFLPASKIVGRAYRISWPPERNRPLP